MQFDTLLVVVIVAAAVISVVRRFFAATTGSDCSCTASCCRETKKEFIVGNAKGVEEKPDGGSAATRCSGCGCGGR